MQQCRLCLRERRQCISIFTCNTKESVTLAEILTSIANIKVSKDDGLTDQICKSCVLKARDMYKFKLQIEWSYVELQKLHKIKRISFNNIRDIDEWEIKLGEIDIKTSVPLELTEYFLTDTEQSFQFRDVELKKKSLVEDSNKMLDCIVPVKEELDYDCEYEDLDVNCHILSEEINQECDSTCDQQTNICNKTNATLPPTTKKYELFEKSSGTIYPRKPIKPVILKNYKLMPFITKPRKRLSDKDKQERTKKETVCPYCGKLIQTQTINSHLIIHGVGAKKKYECDMCGSVFLYRSRIVQHITTQHRPRNFKCDRCVAEYRSRHELERHKFRHSAQKSFVCEICSKAFSWKSGYTRHVNLMHNLAARKYWKCEVCSETLNSKHGLINHMRVHTGERPYCCQICRQPYSYKHDFTRHCLKKHGVCFKKRLVKVLDEETLAKERVLMRELILKLNGVVEDDRQINPFDGPLGPQAFEHVKKAIHEGKIRID